jgi:uncharacterized protein (DUF697 family)
MTDEVKATIHKSSVTSSVTSAAIGAVLSPVPLADELALAGVYFVMARRIVRAHGLAGKAAPWRAMARTGVNGLVARAVANLAVSYIPGVAAVANAATAALLCEIFGAAFDEACADPANARAISVRDLGARLRALAGAAGSAAPIKAA